MHVDCNKYDLRLSGPDPDYCRAIRSTLIRSSRPLSAAITWAKSLAPIAKSSRLVVARMVSGIVLCETAVMVPKGSTHGHLAHAPAVDVRLGHALADHVNPVPMGSLPNNRVALPPALDGHAFGDAGQGQVAEALQFLDLLQDLENPDQFLGTHVGDDPTVDHVDDAIGMVEDALVVRDDHDRRSCRAIGHLAEETP